MNQYMTYILKAIWLWPTNDSVQLIAPRDTYNRLSFAMKKYLAFHAKELT